MIDWKNGQPYSLRFGDAYYSADSGLEERRHVFLHGNRLHERFAALKAGESLSIGETGFGTGLNFLCAWQLFERVAPPGASLDFLGIEKFPLDDDDMAAALRLWPELQGLAKELISRWKRRVPGWNRWHFAAGRVRLTLALCDVTEALREMPCGVDAWFLDGFASALNPEMWAEPVLGDIGRLSNPGATLATYTCAGRVRRALGDAGFSMERTEGLGCKREMLRGCKPGTRAQQVSPSSVLVIGAGLAGCTVASALAQRGMTVTLADAAPALASGASGNPRGILHARLGGGMNALHRFVLASYGHALALFDEVQPADGVSRAECGLLQLAIPGGEEKRIAKLAALPWPAHLLRAVDAGEASALVGMPMDHGGVWFPAGGWVVPPQLCASLVDHARIVQHMGMLVSDLIPTANGWRAETGDGRMVEAERVVVCCGHRARALSQFAQLPLTAVRGQISLLAATAASEELRAVVCAGGYCAPALAGRHVVGATHLLNDDSLDVRPADHAENLAMLAAHVPAMRRALGEPDVTRLPGRAGVRCSVPGAMPLVAEMSPGLYCSLAHGTRGLLTAGLSAEVIAAQMHGQMPPLPKTLLDALQAPLISSRSRMKTWG
ncbi:MAG: bifunctional tRNA (5-methylaminomethyl-2-thiouridine)(34)-methyltransferase MnmD/FAD-dependent 5-carboxymethylaminomethyl-2-thiouridine(34) oxidoreductase MnmC [Gallionella sp.]|nr:bifunctional tRNA (5-methylaminomethyl-2-thiouridine)(34)-methyltransferase MnmD/FAD-dependent 5-carboxymethylaminomethyl-2-thiouridine(34) oxidoreductase MnmC [Gallionella sp.]